MLRSGRRRQQELAEREGAGERLWTSAFTDEVRTKIKLAAADTIGGYGDDIYGYAHGLLIRQWGCDQFTTQATTTTGDLMGALKLGDNDLVADVVEALYAAIAYHTYGYGHAAYQPAAGPGYFADEVNRIFREERVAFELIQG
jgi:hypothetical protein